MQKKPLTPPLTGQGELMLGRHTSQVAYSYRLAREAGGKGSLRGEPAQIRLAFNNGDGRLRLEDGSELALRFVAHTTGTDEVFFEIRR